jgi:hypothetical protein
VVVVAQLPLCEVAVCGTEKPQDLKIESWLPRKLVPLVFEVAVCGTEKPQDLKIES